MPPAACTTAAAQHTQQWPTFPGLGLLAASDTRPTPPASLFRVRHAPARAARKPPRAGKARDVGVTGRDLSNGAAAGTLTVRRVVGSARRACDAVNRDDIVKAILRATDSDAQRASRLSHFAQQRRHVDVTILTTRSRPRRLLSDICAHSSTRNRRVAAACVDNHSVVVNNGETAAGDFAQAEPREELRRKHPIPTSLSNFKRENERTASRRGE